MHRKRGSCASYRSSHLDIVTSEEVQLIVGIGLIQLSIGAMLVRVH